MDRAQRLRPGDHADRAVRVDDGHAHISAQSGARQAARRAARAARGAATRSDSRPDADPRTPRRARRPAGRDPRGDHGGRDASNGNRQLHRFSGLRYVRDLSAGAVGVRRWTQRQVQVDRGGRRDGQASGARPASVCVASRGRRRSVPRVRRGHLGPPDRASRSTHRLPAAPAWIPTILRSAGR